MLVCVPFLSLPANTHLVGAEVGLKSGSPDLLEFKRPSPSLPSYGVNCSAKF